MAYTDPRDIESDAMEPDETAEGESGKLTCPNCGAEMKTIDVGQHHVGSCMSCGGTAAFQKRKEKSMPAQTKAPDTSSTMTEMKPMMK